MLVGFTGAQCTGKTTLLKILEKELPNDEWNFVPEVTRKVKREGLNINEDGDNITQLFILKEHLQNHIINQSENWILDRCILDGYVFTKWLWEQGSVEKWVLDYAGKMLSLLGSRLNYILYTEPEDIVIEDDGERSVNSSFRKEIVNIYEGLMSSSVTTPGKDTWRNKVIRLSGSVDQRIETILKIIK